MSPLPALGHGILPLRSAPPTGVTLRNGRGQLYRKRWYQPTLIQGMSS